MSERTVEQLEKDRALLGEQQRSLEDLVRHPGWAVLIALANETLGTLERDAKLPLESLLDVPKQEYVKGQLAGVRLVFSLPTSYTEGVETQLEMLDEQITIQQEIENAPNRHSSGNGALVPDSDGTGLSP